MHCPPRTYSPAAHRQSPFPASPGFEGAFPVCSACVVCGDGIKNGDEECDGDDGAECDAGQTGTATCTEQCTLDKTNCVSGTSTGDARGHSLVSWTIKNARLPFPVLKRYPLIFSFSFRSMHSSRRIAKVSEPVLPRGTRGA